MKYSHSQKLRDDIKESPLSVAQIARDTQIPATCIYDFVKGETKTPTYENGVKIVEVLKKARRKHGK